MKRKTKRAVKPVRRSRVLTAAFLEKKGACNVEQFRETFGERVLVTVPRARKYAPIFGRHANWLREVLRPRVRKQFDCHDGPSGLGCPGCAFTALPPAERLVAWAKAFIKG